MSQSQYHQLYIINALQARHQQEQLSSSYKLIGYNNCTDEGKWNCSIPFSLLIATRKLNYTRLNNNNNNINNIKNEVILRLNPSFSTIDVISVIRRSDSESKPRNQNDGPGYGFVKTYFFWRS